MSTIPRACLARTCNYNCPGGTCILTTLRKLRAEQSRARISTRSYQQTVEQHRRHRAETESEREPS